LNDWQCLTDDTFRLHRIKGFLNLWKKNFFWIRLIITFSVMKNARQIMTMFGRNHQSWHIHWSGHNTKRHQILVNEEKRGKKCFSGISWHWSKAANHESILSENTKLWLAARLNKTKSLLDAIISRLGYDMIIAPCFAIFQCVFNVCSMSIQCWLLFS